MSTFNIGLAMVRRQNLSLGTTAVLAALAEGLRYGFDIMEQTGLSSGSVYPALERLEALGLATSHWEDQAIAQAEKRPPRRYFEITASGRDRLAELMKRYRCLAPVAIGRHTHPRAAP